MEEGVFEGGERIERSCSLHPSAPILYKFSRTPGTGLNVLIEYWKWREERIL